MASKRSSRVSKEPVAAVEVVDEGAGKGMTFEMGLVITTTILLLFAVFLVMKALGNDYGVGPFGG
ncbi:MAG TPA: hypothetical protein ENK02_15995 [Planctomycetes bacterium]|nr:hypothetical protein [Planctomycetota bacterium]